MCDQEKGRAGERQTPSPPLPLSPSLMWVGYLFPRPQLPDFFSLEHMCRCLEHMCRSLFQFTTKFIGRRTVLDIIVSF